MANPKKTPSPPGALGPQTSTSRRTQNASPDPPTEHVESAGAVANSPAASPPERIIDWASFDPRAVEANGDDTLMAELLTYKARLPELLKNEGEFVLIKGEQVVGIFSTL